MSSHEMDLPIPGEPGEDRELPAPAAVAGALEGAGTAMAPLLTVENLEVVYHHVALAVQGVSFTVPRRSITAIIGSNGAGKTTTLRAIAGFIGADNAAINKGAVVYNGHSLVGRRPEWVCARGVVLVPEREKIFEHLTVGENLRVNGARAQAAGLSRAIDLDAVIAYFPVLGERRRQLAGYLSGGERQMLAIGQALLCSPTLLMVDELSMGLAPSVSAHLFAMLVRLRDELGLTVLLVEQNARGALEIADYGYVFENGRIVFEGTPTRLLEQEDIQEFYLGVSGQDSARSYRHVKQYRRRRRWYG